MVQHLIVGNAKVLVISQTEAVREIAALLAELREAKQPAAAGKDKYNPPYVFKPTPAEEKILAALDAPMKLALNKSPLSEAVDSLKAQYKIEIQLDRKAMDEAGIDTNTYVTQDPKAATLRAALKSMLPAAGLTYVVQDNALLITTKEAAESKLATRIYPVTDLAKPWRNTDGKLWGDCTALVGKIRSTIQPESWDTNGGPGSIAEYLMGNVEVLVISQTQDVHEEVAAMLAMLHKTKQSGKEPPLPLKQNPATGSDRSRIVPRAVFESWSDGSQ